MALLFCLSCLPLRSTTFLANTSLQPYPNLRRRARRSLPAPNQNPHRNICTASATPTWQRTGRTSILLPAHPTLLIHFIGGAFAGSAPDIAYRALLEGVSRETDAGIIATGFDVSGDHWSIAEDVVSQWETALDSLDRDVKKLQVVGLGHSLGGKVTVMLQGREELKKRAGRRVGNVMMAFNNYGVGNMMGGMSKVVDGIGDVAEGFGLDREIVRNTIGNVDVASILKVVGERTRGVAEGLDLSQRFGEGFNNVFDKVAKVTEVAASGKEFTPSPAEVESITETLYGVERTLIIKFSNDTIDESEGLARRLRLNLGEKRVLYREIPGTHVTPLTPNLQQMRNVGNEAVDQVVQKNAEKARRELQQLITIVAAFIKLQVELSKKAAVA